MVLSVTFFDSGIRAIRTVESALPRRHTTTPRRSSPPGTRRPPSSSAPSPRRARPPRCTPCPRPRACPRAPSPRTGGVAPPNAPRALGQSVQRALRGRHVAQHPQHLLGLARHQVSGQHRALTRRMRRPVPFDDACLALHRSDRPLARRARYSVRIAVTGPTAQR